MRNGTEGSGGTRRRHRRRLAGALAVLLATLAPGPAPASAAEPACQPGTDLTPKLAADGRLARIEAEAAKVPNGEGRFWRVEKDGLPPSYLFGTMHLSDPRILARPPAVEAALGAAKTVVIETLDVLDQGKSDLLVLAHPELMMLPAGKSLDDYLSPEEKRESDALFAKAGTPYAAVRTLQPWFTAMGVMLPGCEAARAAAGAHPLDIALALDAKAAGKVLVGLESSLEQLQAMASMDMELQVANLLSILRVKDTIPDLFETLTDFYLAGRIGAIGPLSEIATETPDSPQASGAAYAQFEQRIVTDRNRRMAERLAPQLAAGGVLVAVGALHLPGEEGLVELLRRAGYRVTRAD
ncbi:hypothetical protein GCM10011390_26840 [Aureimonas endophytica]|uniref:TraB family protein n=1 Tax=Aureimonas endophytica TaxID=2027858 RepID=A0A916ZP98_9HYPH|nr:TraB/GumN family protein [Aureimonas endophytica]GGE06357.1 hypothetical protein GCM10011390_26840 [Aureimonas endophytica]